MIAVDVGAQTTPHANSLAYIAETYKPALIYAIDPRISIAEPDEIGGVTIIPIPMIAWTHEGMTGFVEDGSRSRIAAAGHKRACFDLVTFLNSLGHIDKPLLKLDIEGAEYELLAHLIAHGTTSRLSLLLVEWHREHDPEGERERRIRAGVTCPLEDWTM